MLHFSNPVFFIIGRYSRPDSRYENLYIRHSWLIRREYNLILVHINIKSNHKWITKQNPSFFDYKYSDHYFWMDHSFLPCVFYFYWSLYLQQVFKDICMFRRVNVFRHTQWETENIFYKLRHRTSFKTSNNSNKIINLIKNRNRTVKTEEFNLVKIFRNSQTRLCEHSRVFREGQADSKY